ncbi:hypothetical protein BVC80_8911g27 [Macleaya cordata]|uniref:Uncharacterized protein n=1 Tax=Macleaya cordata TaxID=56857 RepID=A0A200QIR2_MACCD|nr:hypothetical protein BVC80_8911g27 [Macleaya cordata]
MGGFHVKLVPGKDMTLLNVLGFTQDVGSPAVTGFENYYDLLNPLLWVKSFLLVNILLVMGFNGLKRLLMEWVLHQLNVHTEMVASVVGQPTTGSKHAPGETLHVLSQIVKG